MNATAKRRAEGCFALARGSAFEGERAAAMNRGLTICEAYGLSLDDFDIPGRARDTAAKVSNAAKSPERFDAAAWAQSERVINGHARKQQIRRAADFLFTAGRPVYPSGHGRWYAVGVGDLDDAELMVEAIEMGFSEVVL